MNKLAPLIPHLPQDRESVPSVSGPHNPSFQQLSQCYLLVGFCVFQEAAFYEVLQQKKTLLEFNVTHSLATCQLVSETKLLGNCDDAMTECSFWPAKNERNE